MLAQCPKCGHRQPPGAPAACPACGLVFAKYEAAQRGEPVRRARAGVGAPTDAAPWWDDYLAVPDRVDTWQVLARIALYAFLVVWGWRLWALDIRTGEIGASLTHAVNLVFHEAGHVLFWPFGEFLRVAGGTLLQWLMPVAALVALRRTAHDNFGASLALWWLAISVIDAAPYAYDARHPQLTLLHGGTGDTGAHDWIEMLGDLGMLSRAHGVGHLLHWAGFALLALANAWGALVLRRQWRNRTEGPASAPPD